MKGPALLFSGLALFFQGQYPSARSLIEESLSLLIKAGERGGSALGLWDLGGLALFEGDHVTARTLREHIRATLPMAADGSIHLIARAWAVRGRT